MCPFNPREQARLANKSFNAVDMMTSAMQSKPPWDSIVDFATHRSFCGFPIFPRQATLLKLIFLETENMTQYDIDVIDEWRRGFVLSRDPFGVQPDIWHRVEYLKKRGYRRFPHIQMVLGRRASKGALGGLLGCEQIAYLHSKDNPQKFYGIDENKDIYLNVGGTSQTQAARQLFADVRTRVEKCQYFYPKGQQPWIAETKDAILRVRTPADLRYIAELRAAGAHPDHIIASLVATACSASSVAGRGQTSYGNFYDEFAFHVQTGSVKSDTEIYKDWQPSLGQFKNKNTGADDSLTYLPSSPACLQPSTLVLTEDLRWVPVGSLGVGDRLIGFDEYPEPGRGRARTWQPTVVTETSVFDAPRYELTTEGGKHITSTDDHLWLVRRVGGMGRGRGRGQRSQSYPQKFCWVKTIDLRPGDQIKSLGVEPWETDESRDGGYLAGFFDADGHLAVNGKQLNLGFTQLPGQAYDHVRALLKERGFDVRNDIKLAYVDSRGVRNRSINKDRILGGFPEIMRFLGSIRPERLSLPSFLNRLYGSRIYSNGGQAVDTVVSVKRVDDGPVVALGTSTSTLVAEGLLSHNTKAGQFYVLYEQGKVTMSTYDDDTGLGEEARQNLINVGRTAELECEPTWLIFQAPSWGLYEDWHRAHKILGLGYAFDKPPEPDLSDERQIRERTRDPVKFRVEKQGQFSEVVDQYLDSDKVDAMFVTPDWREPLAPVAYGTFDRKYRIHCDPGRTGANFSLAVAHLEDAPPDEHGRVWPHVVFDYLHVWRPMDFPEDPETHKRTIDYVQVHSDIEDIVSRFMSTEKISFDQWNSASFIASLRQRFMPDIRVAEVTFAEKENQVRCEKFKSALNLGWVHAYTDNFYLDDVSCLLELELKFLSEKNGKVIRQETGPVTTKDLADAVMVVTVDLLHDALDRWSSGRLTAGAFGTTDVAGIKSGRELDRLAEGRAKDTKLWRAMDEKKTANLNNRRRGGRYAPDRLSSIHGRQPKATKF